MGRSLRVLSLLAIFLTVIVTHSDASKLAYKRRITDLRDWNNEGLVPFDDSLLDQYIFVSPRNYSLFLFLGASEQQCQPCKHIESLIAQISRAHQGTLPGKSFNTSSTFFGRVMFEDAHNSFQNLGVNAVPALLYIKPSSSDNTKPQFAKYPFKDISAVNTQDIYNWMSQVAGLPKLDLPAPEAPIDFTMYFLLAFVGVFALQGLKIGWKHRKNPIAWYYLCLGIIFVVFAGTVFNAIHTPPPFYISRTGQIMLIYPSMRQQFIFEGILVAFLIVSASGLWILLTTWVPEISNSGERRRVFTVCGIGIIIVLNLLFKIFSLKNPGYPYRFYLF